MIKHCKLCKNFNVERDYIVFHREGGKEEHDFISATCNNTMARKVFEQLLKPEEDEPGSIFSNFNNINCPYFLLDYDFANELKKEINTEEYANDYWFDTFVVSRYNDDGSGRISIVKKIGPDDTVIYMGEERECVHFVRTTFDLHLQIEEVKVEEPVQQTATDKLVTSLNLDDLEGISPF